MIGPYVPLLKGKLGELRGVGRIPTSKKVMFTPLFDIPQMSVESGEDVPSSLDDYLRKRVSDLAKAWGCEDRAIFVDLFDTDPSACTRDGKHPLTTLFDLLRDAGVQAIPTTGLDRDDSYQSAVSAIAGIDRRGVCLRMLRDDLASGYALSSALGDLLARLNADRSQADLLMDFRQIDAAGAKDVAATAAKAVNGLAGVAEWRSLIFAASNMPRSLREFPRDAVGSVPRVEFDVWRDIVGRGLKRTPSFGDYGVVHPDHIYADKTFNVSASIKYTLEDRWLIARGQSLFGDRGYAQYYGLARLLTKQKDFKGNDYNWANEEIENKAKRRGTTGNPTTWISVGTHRHVTFVASQVGETLADAS